MLKRVPAPESACARMQACRQCKQNARVHRHTGEQAQRRANINVSKPEGAHERKRASAQARKAG
eukprot:6053948-Alexandrium_andersonii.AAC.1